MARRPNGESIWLVVPLLLSALVYFPITRDYFHTDDFAQFLRARDYGSAYYIFMQEGGHITPFRNGIYYLSQLFFNIDPRPYFWIALLLHLVNVALLWRVIRGFTRSARLACFGSALWGICLLHQGALGWWSAHGHIFAATAMLAVLAHFAALAERSQAPSRHARLLWYVLACIAATSFGVGMGFALALPVLAVLLVPHWRSVWRWPPCLTLWLVVPLLYTIGLRWNGEALVSNTIHTTLVDRGASFPAAMVRLPAFGIEWLFAGLFPLTPADAVSYVPLALLVLAALALASRSSATVRRQLAACALLTTALYGMIALGRGFFLQRAKVEELLQLSYYHYTPLLPVALAISILLREAAELLRLRASMGAGITALWTGATFAALAIAPPSFDLHDQERAEHDRAVANLDCQINASVPARPVFIYGTGRAKAFIRAFPSNVVDGHHIFFVDDAIPIPRRRGRRSRTLYVSAIGVPKSQLDYSKRLRRMCAVPRKSSDEGVDDSQDSSPEQATTTPSQSRDADRFSIGGS